MRGYSLVLVAAISLAMLTAVPCAQAWLQSGAIGGIESAYNNGASAEIQTVYQNISIGSLGFWIGETLDNGAFAQVGYEIVNQSAYYPTYCDISGCSGSEYIRAGVPTWFWEYFPSNSSQNDFYGGIGTNASVGPDGAFNTYSFKSSGNVWHFYVNGQEVGSVDLGTSSSGRNAPGAYAEVAGTYTDSFVMKTVQFKNVALYDGSVYALLPRAYSSVTYGKGSDRNVPNVYGVKEIGRSVNYFEVGSGLPTQSGTLLWQQGYSLTVSSEYGNVAGSGNYLALSPITLSSPSAIDMGNATREVFAGWKGTGIGSYSGNASTITVTMLGNITEQVVWQKQYYLNINSSVQGASGAGWYDAGSTARLALEAAIVGISDGTRLAFAGWSNGATNSSTGIVMDSPKNITAQWDTEYLVNATTTYGNVIGNGWYVRNSTARISLSETATPAANDSRMAFQSWSDGNANSSAAMIVTAPVTIDAKFARQYLVTLVPENAYGEQISDVSYFNISGTIERNSSVFLFENRKYNVEYAHYKGTNVDVNYAIEPSAPEIVNVMLPVYDVSLSARSMFGTPVNAVLDIAFKNGTFITTSTGSNGTLALRDVPYGYVIGNARYFGVTESIAISGGNGSTMTFITPGLVMVVLAGIALVVSVAVVSKRIKERKGRAQEARQ